MRQGAESSRHVPAPWQSAPNAGHIARRRSGVGLLGVGWSRRCDEHQAEPPIKSTRVHRATNGGAPLSRGVTYFRREAHHRVTAVRRDRALANPPPSHAPALVGDRAGR